VNGDADHDTKISQPDKALNPLLPCWRHHVDELQPARNQQLGVGEAQIYVERMTAVSASTLLW